MEAFIYEVTAISDVVLVRMLKILRAEGQTLISHDVLQYRENSFSVTLYGIYFY